MIKNLSSKVTKLYVKREWKRGKIKLISWREKQKAKFKIEGRVFWFWCWDEE